MARLLPTGLPFSLRKKGFGMHNAIPSVAMIVAIVVGAMPSPVESAPPTCSLRSRRAEGSLDRVEVALEVGGDLRMAADRQSTDEKNASIPMRAVAGLAYDERTLQGGSSQPPRSVRYYDRAKATIKVGEGGAQPELREERRLVGVQVDGPKTTLFSPRGPFNREELDLIDIVGKERNHPEAADVRDIAQLLILTVRPGELST